MTITLSVSGTPTATTAQFALANIGASGTVELQLAMKKNFAFCVAPIITGLPLSSPVSLSGLNQASPYYARARTRLSSGIAEPWSNVVAFYTPLSAAQQAQASPIVMQPALVVPPIDMLSLTGFAGGTGQIGEVPGFPATNLLLDAPVSWHAYSPTGAYALQANFSGAPIDTIAMLSSNLPESANVSVQAGTTSAQATNSPLYTLSFPKFRASANLPNRPKGYHSLLRLPTPQSYPWWNINISGLPPGGFLSMDYLVMGLGLTSKTATVGITETGLNLGSLDRSRSGIPDRQDGYRMRHVEFDISYMTETQYQLLYRELHFRVNEPILIVPNSVADGFLHDRVLFGNLNSGKSQTASSLHQTKSFAIDSLI